MTPYNPTSSARRPRLSRRLWLGPALYMLVVSFYFLARYDGRWAETDSAAFALINRNFVEQGQLAPSGEIYPNGYTYQAVSATITALTGLDVATLQQLLFPLLAPLVVLPAWALYRDISGTARGAVLSTVLLLTQPEFLFVILRSSHEKFTRTLLLLCILLLARSFALRGKPWQFAVHVGFFYLLAYALLAGNALLANSFFIAAALAMLCGFLWDGLLAITRRLRRHGAPDPREADESRLHRHMLKRLLYVTLICLGLFYLFVFHLYTPSQHSVLAVRDLFERSANVITNQAKATNAYDYVNVSWLSIPIYLLVSIANWIVLGAAAIIWLHRAVRWLWRGETPATPAERLVWLLFAAFIIQGIFTVITDRSGALGGNIQVRLFPALSITGVGLVGAALSRWRPCRYGRPIGMALAGGIFCIAILSIFKVTNEPALSNKWTFYRADELAALEWVDQRLSNSEIWTEFDERLMVAYHTVHARSQNGNLLRGFYHEPTMRHILVSSLTHLRSSRLQQPLPMPPDALRIYDNGEAQMYHVRPVTPYQK